MAFYTRLAAFSLTLAFIISPQASGQSRTDDKTVWDKVIKLSEALIGEGGLIDAKGAEGKLDALVDLHVAFCDEMTGKRTSSQRVMAVKQGVRLFLKTAGERYKGNKRKAILRILRDLATNRAVFIEILTSNSPSAVIEQRMLAYLERNQGMSYKEPVPIPKQVSVIQSDAPLQIIKDGIRLVSDSGTYGHYNKAIDAGEVITLNIPLKNVSKSPFRSTSGFLQTTDKYVRIGNSEVLYTERSEVDGQTVTFAPGKSITPGQHFIFTLSPNCPDGHKINFTLLAWDSDRGKHKIPLTVTVYHVGPLDFGSLKIDDDIPGPSNGNDNDVMEPGETIEYVLSLQNRGSVLVTDISASLFTSSPMVKFQPRGDSLKYKKVEPKMERPISSSFVFTLAKPDPKMYSQIIERMIRKQGVRSPDADFRVLIKGTSRNHTYSWIQQNKHSIGVSDLFYRYALAAAQKKIDNTNSSDAIALLSHSFIKYRCVSDNKAMDILVAARKHHQGDLTKRKLLSQIPVWTIYDRATQKGSGLGFISAIGPLTKAIRIEHLDGQLRTHTVKIAMEVKHPGRRRTAAYVYGNQRDWWREDFEEFCPVSLSIECEGVVKKEGIGRVTLKTYAIKKIQGGRGRPRTGVSASEINLEGSRYVDAGPLRFVYNAKGEYLKIDVYRLGSSESLSMWAAADDAARRSSI